MATSTSTSTPVLPPLLVALRGPADLSGSLAQAAARARAEHRPLSVVVVEPARAWTIDAAVIAVQDRRRRREIASMTAAAGAVCARAGVTMGEVTVLRPAWAWTRTGRDRRIDMQLAEIAHRGGAELHPAPSGRATSGTGVPATHRSAALAGSAELPVGAR